VTLIAPEAVASADDLPDGRRPVDDTLARQVIAIIDASGVVEEVAAWKEAARRGPGGRPERFPTRALLATMALCALTDQPMHATRYCDIMFRQLSPAVRVELGIPDPPSAKDFRGWAAAYRAVRYRFHAMCGTMDPSPRPKGRRLDDATHQAQTGARRAELTPEQWAERYDRLTVFINQILEASIRLVPPDVLTRWQGSVGVDATLVRSHARAENRAARTKGRTKAAVVTHSADPDAGFYSRPADDRDVDGLVRRGKLEYGHEGTLVVSGPDDPRAQQTFPHLVVAMSPLHQPGRQVGPNAIVALTNLRQRGHPAHSLAGDRAYTSAKAEEFQLPAHALGYDLVLDYKID
jgi:hypothetical protein